MEKINQVILNKASAAKIYWKKNQGKILFLIGVFFLLKYLTGLPYINLILNHQDIFVILSVLIIIVFKLSRKLYFFVAFFCLFLSLPFLLIGDQRTAERFGDLIYWFLILGFVGEMWHNRIFIKSQRD